MPSDSVVGKFSLASDSPSGSVHNMNPLREMSRCFTPWAVPGLRRSITVLGVFAGLVATAQEKNTEPGAIVQRYFQEVVNENSAQAAGEILMESVVLHSPPAVTRLRDAYIRSMSSFHSAFPDLKFTVEDMVSQPGKAVARWTFTGTQKGGFQGQPPSGKAVRITGMSFFRIEKGRIMEIWANMDRLGMMQQLGLIPTPEPSSPSKAK
ncbi:MAG: ester cyclase [Verrucomicrobia bacterium]|nr:ester cyclase [Verrucomicrobiota bacterium]